MQITYQKRNGDMFQKLRKTILPYKIGETTSMGWKVLNIEYEYKSKYYPEYEYNILIHKNKQKKIRINHYKNICIKEMKTLFYYFIVVSILINIFK